MFKQLPEGLTYFPDKQFANSSPESHQFEKGKRKVFEILEHLRYYISKTYPMLFL